MFEANDEVTAMVGLLYDACDGLKRGDVLTRETIGSIVGVYPNTFHWGYVVRQVRRRMERDRHISMMPVIEVGFSLCTIPEQIALGEYRQKRAGRQIRRGERSLKALESVKGLTMHQRRLREVSLNGLRKTRLKIAEEMRTARALATPTLPRRRGIDGE